MASDDSRAWLTVRQYSLACLKNCQRLIYKNKIEKQERKKKQLPIYLRFNSSVFPDATQKHPEAVTATFDHARDKFLTLLLKREIYSNHFGDGIGWIWKTQGTGKFLATSLKLLLTFGLKYSINVFFNGDLKTAISNPLCFFQPCYIVKCFTDARTEHTKKGTLN